MLPSRNLVHSKPAASVYRLLVQLMLLRLMLLLLVVLLRCLRILQPAYTRLALASAANRTYWIQMCAGTVL